MKRKIYKDICETVYTTTLENKMKVYLLYKPGFSEKTAFIATKFGHFDSIRRINVNGKNMKIPYGVAHFLEHRMFSINDKDASDLFSSLGATSNAYTTFEKTAYYFSTQKNFYECLKILLTMMDSFTSTSKQIENEKSIIIQEANMYKENPSHVLNQAILETSYKKHPIRNEIIGTNKTIKETTKEILQAVFNKFYDPSNLSLVVCGDIDHKELESFLNDNLLACKNTSKIKPLKIKEPEDVVSEYKEIKLSTITLPRMALLYKLPVFKDKQEKDKMFFCYNLILDYLFASSGKLSEKWLQEGIISNLFEYSVSSNIDLDYLIIYNISSNVDDVVNNIKRVFNTQNSLNITQTEFDDLKKTHYGATIRAYESVMGLSSYFVDDLFTSANDFFDEIDEVRKLTIQDMEKAFNNISNAKTSLVVLKGE